MPEGTGTALEDLARRSKLAALVVVDARDRSAIKGLVQDGRRNSDEPLI